MESLIIKRFFMAAILDRIVAATRARVADARREADLRELEQRAELHVPRGFRRALAARSREGVAVIAELKKASPSTKRASGRSRARATKAASISRLLLAWRT